MFLGLNVFWYQSILHLRLGDGGRKTISDSCIVDVVFDEARHESSSAPARVVQEKQVRIDKLISGIITTG